MTSEQAAEVAAFCYGGHPAAASLMLEICNGTDADRRRRSARALEWLDEAEPCPELAPLPSALESPARAISFLVLECVYHPDRAERQRVAHRLQAVCTEAARLAATRRPAA